MTEHTNNTHCKVTQDNPITILYEDSHIIVCQKPIGMLSQSDDKGAPNMVDALSVQFPKADIKVLHRLDREVGGVMVYAKTKSAAAGLSKDISNHTFQKEYVAVVSGCPSESSGIYKDLLFKDSRKNKSFVVKRMRKGVKEASLEYNTLGQAISPVTLPTQTDNVPSNSKPNNTQDIAKDITKGIPQGSPISCVKIKLHTGRTHQIRVQFSSRKMPLLGDTRYGSQVRDCTIALWSYQLQFVHPITKKEMSFTCPPPTEIFPWNCFSGDI